MLGGDAGLWGCGWGGEVAGHVRRPTDGAVAGGGRWSPGVCG